MVATTLPGVMLTGVVGSRPAASAVASGTLYSGTDTSLIYQSDGATWTTWATLTGTGLTGGTPAVTLGTANAAGAASTGVRTDATILAFDATVPAALGTAAAGSAGTAARRDHVHPIQSYHGVRVHNSAVQSCTTAVATAITYDTEDFDTDAFHSTASNTSRLVVPTGFGGYYQIIAGGYFNDTTAGNTYDFNIKLNNATNIAFIRSPADSTRLVICTIPALYKLVATDYVEFVVTQSAGVSKNFQNDSAFCFFGMSLLGI